MSIVADSHAGTDTSASADAGSAALHFHNVTIGYERHPAVHHLSGRVACGAMLAVCGPNGAGKSTLLKAIAGLLTPLDGRIDRPLCPVRRIGYLPQMCEMDRSFPIDVRDAVAMGLWRRTGAWRGLGARQHSNIADALTAVGLEGFGQRQIATLSGGQMQRMLFARLMVQDAPLVLLDEPFTAVDEQSTADLMAIIRSWHAEGRTIIAVLHDLDLARAHFPQTLLLAREPVAWGPTGATLSHENLARARGMIEAFDRQAPECHRHEEV